MVRRPQYGITSRGRSQEALPVLLLSVRELLTYAFRH